MMRLIRDPMFWISVALLVGIVGFQVASRHA